MDNQTSLFNCSVFNYRPNLSDKSNKRYLLVTNTARAMQNFLHLSFKKFFYLFLRHGDDYWPAVGAVTGIFTTFKVKEQLLDLFLIKS